MKKLFTFKKIKIPFTNETKFIDSVQLWYVEWYSRYGSFNAEIQKEIEAFTSEEAAKQFKESLDLAYKLLRHSSGTSTRLYTKQTQQNG